MLRFLWELSPGPSHSCSATGREGCGWQRCPGEGMRGAAPWARERLQSPTHHGTRGMHSYSPSQSRHRDAHLLLNPGSWAPACPVPLQEGESQGCSEPVQEGRAGFPRKGSGMAAQPQTTQEPLQQSAHLRDALWDALWKPRAQPWTWGSSSDTKGTDPTEAQNKDGGTPQSLMAPWAEPQPNWRHRRLHTPVPSAPDPQVPNEYFRFQPYLQLIKKPQ